MNSSIQLQVYKWFDKSSKNTLNSVQHIVDTEETYVYFSLPFT